MCITLPIVIRTLGVQKRASKYHLRNGRAGAGIIPDGHGVSCGARKQKGAQIIREKSEKRQKFE